MESSGSLCVHLKSRDFRLPVGAGDPRNRQPANPTYITLACQPAYQTETHTAQAALPEHQRLHIL